jgi:hypothetical protein
LTPFEHRVRLVIAVLLAFRDEIGCAHFPRLLASGDDRPGRAGV